MIQTTSFGTDEIVMNPLTIPKPGSSLTTFLTQFISSQLMMHHLL